MRRGRRKWPIYLCGGVAFALLLALMSWAAVTRRSEEQVRRIAHEAGIPTSMTELYPPYAGDPKNNAASYARELYREQSAANKQGYRLVDFLEDPSPFEQKLPLYAAYFALLERACEAKDWSPDLKKPSEALFCFQHAAELLCIRSRLRTKEGDFNGALEDVRRIAKIATLISRDPSQVQDLGIGATSSAYRASFALLPHAATDPQFEAELGKALGSIKPYDFHVEVRNAAAHEAILATTFLPSRYTWTPKNLWQRTVPMEATRYAWGPARMKAFVQILHATEASPYSRETKRKAVEDFMKPLDSVRDYRMASSQWSLGVLQAEPVFLDRLQANKDLFALSLSALKAHRAPSVEGTRDPSSASKAAPYHVASTETGWKVWSDDWNHIDDGGIKSPQGRYLDFTIEFDGKEVKVHGY